MPALLYGEGHPYGDPLTGSGTSAAFRSMTRADLVKFHDTWFRPNNSTMIVVGDTTMEQIKPKLEKLFAGWKSWRGSEEKCDRRLRWRRSRRFI